MRLVVETAPRGHEVRVGGLDVRETLTRGPLLCE